MAAKALFPTAAKIIHNVRNTLQLVKGPGHLNQLPRQLCIYEQTRLNLLQDYDIKAWLDVVQISPPIVMSLAV